MKFLRRTIPETISLTFEFEPGDYIVKADPTQIQQVLSNLVVNSRDAMPEGGEIKIKLKEIDIEKGKEKFTDMKPGRWVVLSVIDNGTGIPEDVLPHIFEPFFTTKPPGKGTGLGLSQVYGIVRQHDGFIDVKTEVGKGTEFDIYLPAISQPKKDEKGKEEKAVERIGKGELILFVEDEPYVLEVGKQVLEELGFEVLTATDGESALLTYREHAGRIKLVLSDIVMPKLDGIKLAKRLKEEDPEIKVIGVSGYPLRKDKGELKIFDGWIQKPFNIDSLLGVLKNVLSSKADENA